MLNKWVQELYDKMHPTWKKNNSIRSNVVYLGSYALISLSVCEKNHTRSSYGWFDISKSSRVEGVQQLKKTKDGVAKGKGNRGKVYSSGQSHF